MKIVINGDELIRIIKTCKTCVENSEIRPVLGLIELDCAGGEGYATSLDGFKLIQARFAYTGDDGVMLIPPFSGINKYSTYEIEYETGLVSIDDGDEKIIRRIHGGPFIDWRSVTKKTIEPKYTIAVNPRYLKKVLDGVKEGGLEAVILDFYEELSGFFVRGEKSIGMVLPMRMHGQCEKFMKFCTREPASKEK